MSPIRSHTDAPAPLAPDDVELLLDLAEATLAGSFSDRRVPPPAPSDPASLPAAVRHECGVFVTLKVDGQLNGCIGTIEASEPLADAVPRLALAAAFHDPRLPPLRPEQLDGLDIELSLLSPLAPLAVRERSTLVAALVPGRHGLQIEHRSGRAVFLPQVWEQLPDPDDFLDQLWHKAGFVPRTWPHGLRCSTFTVEHHGRTVRR